MTQVFRGFARGRYIFTGGMPQFEAFINNPNSPRGPELFRAVSAARSARRPIDRRVGQPGHSGVGAGIFIQDKWSVRPNLTINAGLRWEGHNSPPMLTRPRETPFAQYLNDPRFPTDTGEIPDDYGGWQPRLGITWDPTSDGKTVVRGTAGIFKARTPGPRLGKPTHGQRRHLRELHRRHRADAGWQLQLRRARLPDARRHRELPQHEPRREVVDKDFQNPRSWQWSLSAEREIMPNMAVGAAFNYANTVHLSNFYDPERRLHFTTNAEGRRIYGGVGSPNRPFPDARRGAHHRQRADEASTRRSCSR